MQILVMGILSCDIPVVLDTIRWYRKYSQNTTNKGGVVFITKKTCFGPCTGPSSGLELCLRGDYTV